MMYRITKKPVFKKTIPDLKRLLLLLTMGLCFGLFQNAYAQRTVSGKVIDDTGEGVPGVAVVVKGTDTGSVTDVDGNYSISVPGDNAVLVFSSVGFATKEETVGTRSVLDVTLESSATQLSELVVTGYTVDDRRESTGSVSIVQAKDLTVVPSGNVEQQLQGRVAGVTVITNGQPGTSSQVRVRGYGSFNNNLPLYIVDGVPTFGTEFLNPDDIETTTVLKDATSAGIYGARAAGGVIVYTTRRGKKDAQKLKVYYNGLVGFTTPGNGPDQLNPQEQADFTWAAIRNAAIQNGETPSFTHPQYGTGDSPVLPDFLLVGQQSGVIGSVDLAAEAANYNVTEFDNPDRPIYQVIRANRAGTDWYDAITRTGVMTRHTLGFSGGGKGSRFYVGLGMQEQEGILLHQLFRRYTARINTEFDVHKRVRIGTNLQGGYREVRQLQGGNVIGGGQGSSDDENIINSAYRMSPIIPVFDEFGGYAGTAAPGFNNPRNPVAALDGNRDDRGFALEGFGNVYIEVEPIDGLIYRSSIGGQYQNFYLYDYTRREYENSENNAAFGFSESSQYAFAWTFTNTLQFKKTFGIHSIDVLAGIEALDNGSGRGVGGSGNGVFSEDRDFVTLSTLNTTNPPFSFLARGETFFSYFGRVRYSLNDKYIFTGSLRRDGVSSFGSNNRYGTFPAFSVAWRISSEDFMSGLTWINDLKIRGGWGIIGNANSVPNSNQFNLFTQNIGTGSYDIGGNNTSASNGFNRSNIGNVDGKWEKSITTNIGFDGTFFDNKLDVIFDVWRKDTEDLLIRLPLTVQTGPNAQAPFQNLAEMRNQGIDLKIINRGNVGEVTYEVTFNMGLLENEILSFNGTLESLPGLGNPGFRGINPILNQVGRPLSSFYGYDVVGLFRDQADVDAHATQDGAAPGRFKFRDINGDGEITTDDRTYLGDPIPNLTTGLNFKIGFKNFELESYMFLQTGNDLYNVSRLFTDFYPLFPGAAISARVKDAWSFDNPSGEIPIFENISNFSTNTQSNSFYVENGAYFRMQNITLRYKFAQAVLDNLGMEKLEVYVGLNNVFTISGYKGLDPAIGGDADTEFGIDVGNFPITRSFTFGVNLIF